MGKWERKWKVLYYRVIWGLCVGGFDSVTVLSDTSNQPPQTMLGIM